MKIKNIMFVEKGTLADRDIIAQLAAAGILVVETRRGYPAPSMVTLDDEEQQGSTAAIGFVMDDAEPMYNEDEDFPDGDEDKGDGGLLN